MAKKYCVKFTLLPVEQYSKVAIIRPTLASPTTVECPRLRNVNGLSSREMDRDAEDLAAGELGILPVIRHAISRGDYSISPFDLEAAPASR